MSDRITQSLQRLFEEKRIVFWYDAARDMRAEYDAVQVDGVTKLEIANNEFGLKYRILRQEPEAKFLLYHNGPADVLPDPRVVSWRCGRPSPDPGVPAGSRSSSSALRRCGSRGGS